jgi:hypothetical protein
VVRELAARQETAFVTPGAAEEVNLKPGLRVAQGPGDGQRGVHVAPGPAA